MNLRRTTLWVLSLAVIIMLSGCVTRANYKMLSFFFDGVPDPDKVVIASVSGKKGAAQAVPQGSTHGPFASKSCDACHNRAEGNTLVLPIDKLCVNCHMLNLKDMKWVHGPVASAGCRACHSPHRSGYPFLLDAPVEQLCFNCHEKKSVLKNEVHQDLTSGCTECHNPHASQQKFLLR